MALLAHVSLSEDGRVSTNGDTAWLLWGLPGAILVLGVVWLRLRAAMAKHRVEARRSGRPGWSLDSAPEKRPPRGR